VVAAEPNWAVMCSLDFFNSLDFYNGGMCRVTIHRRGRGDSALSRVSHRGVGGKIHVPGDGVPAASRGTAHQRATEGLALSRHASDVHSRESIKKFLDGFHYDAHPMGMLGFVDCRAFDVLPRREGCLIVLNGVSPKESI
jgi:hypothetical protein